MKGRGAPLFVLKGLCSADQHLPLSACWKFSVLMELLIMHTLKWCLLL